MRECLSRRTLLGQVLVGLFAGAGVLATRRTAMSTDGSDTPGAFKARRILRRKEFEVTAPPEMVFPLLCPVREREWLDGWKADVVYSDSGFAEENAIFTSENPLLGDAVYVVSRHEAAQGRIEFTIFYPATCVQRLRIELQPAVGGGTRLLWSRLFTGLSPHGNASIDKITDEFFDAQMLGVAQSLERHCKRVQAR